MQRPTFVAFRCLSHTLVGEAYSLQRNLWYFYPQPTVSINAKLPCLSIATYTGNVSPTFVLPFMQPVDESYYTPMRTHASFVNLNIVLVPSQSLHWFQVQMGGFWQVPSPPSKWERNCVWVFEIMLLKHLFLCLLSLLMACWHCSCEANRSGRMLVNEIRTQAAASATTVPRRKRTTSGAQIMNTNKARKRNGNSRKLLVRAINRARFLAARFRSVHNAFGYGCCFPLQCCWQSNFSYDRTRNRVACRMCSFGGGRWLVQKRKPRKDRGTMIKWQKYPVNVCKKQE